MKIFNTHTHLNSEKYNELEILDIIETCRVNNIELLVCGYDLKSSEKAVELASEYEFIYAAIGLHPSDAMKFNDTFINDLRNLAKSKKVVAIGEIGFDLYYTKDLIELQAQVFYEQLNLASELDLPVIIHSRDAVNETLKMLEKNLKTKAIIHCYSYSKESLSNFLKLDCSISISGVVTFKNAKSLKEVVQVLPLDKLLVETDCPYLTPVPFRGEINKAHYVHYVIEEIASLRNMTYQEVADITYKNAIDIFNIKEV